MLVFLVERVNINTSSNIKTDQAQGNKVLLFFSLLLPVGSDLLWSLAGNHSAKLASVTQTEKECFTQRNVGVILSSLFFSGVPFCHS